jgi:aspartate racemase
MEQDFYKGRLIENYGLGIITPDEKERALVHKVIYDELCKGILSPESKKDYLRIIARLVEKGAEAVIL